jgi:rhamnulokinase
MTNHYLACDLGAESGRWMVGIIDEGRIEVAEVHRFPNQPIRQGGHLCWDYAALWSGVR